MSRLREVLPPPPKSPDEFMRWAELLYKYLKAKARFVFHTTDLAIPNISTSYVILSEDNSSSGTLSSTIVHNFTVDTNAGTATLDSGVTGAYQLVASFSYRTDTPETVHISLFVNGVEDTSIECERKLSAANDVGNAILTGLVELTKGDVVTIRCRSSSATITLTFNHFNINMTLDERYDIV